MVIYVPGTEETDPKKQNMSLQAIAAAATTAIANVATNTANIATNTTNIATNTTNISALQAKTAGYEAAWTTYTPTITAASGTFTSVSAAGSYLQIGKFVSFICNITITTVGTASGNVVMPLPIGTLKRTFACGGMETQLVGKALGVFGAASAASLSVRYYDVSSAIAAGNVLTVSGTYEQS